MLTRQLNALSTDLVFGMLLYSLVRWYSVLYLDGLFLHLFMFIHATQRMRTDGIAAIAENVRLSKTINTSIGGLWYYFPGTLSPHTSASTFDTYLGLRNRNGLVRVGTNL